jgi:hypothetical protein
MQTYESLQIDLQIFYDDSSKTHLNNITNSAHLSYT